MESSYRTTLTSILESMAPEVSEQISQQFRGTPKGKHDLKGVQHTSIVAGHNHRSRLARRQPLCCTKDQEHSIVREIQGTAGVERTAQCREEEE
jgi:hypothetical protein